MSSGSGKIEVGVYFTFGKFHRRRDPMMTTWTEKVVWKGIFSTDAASAVGLFLFIPFGMTTKISVFFHCYVLQYQ